MKYLFEFFTMFLLIVVFMLVPVIGTKQTPSLSLHSFKQGSIKHNYTSMAVCPKLGSVIKENIGLFITLIFTDALLSQMFLTITY